MSKINRLLKHF